MTAQRQPGVCPTTARKLPNDYPTTGRRLMIFDILVVVSTTAPAKLDRRRNLTKCQMVPIDSIEAAA